MNIDKIIIGSHNPYKKEKLRWIVGGFFDEMADLPGGIEVEEDGTTFEENARIKASFIAQKCGAYTVATDGGILIPSLGNNWNKLLTKRFVGKKDVTDFDRMDALLDMMKDKKGEDRKIVWIEAISISSPEKVLFSLEVEGDTSLLQEGYDRSQYRPGIWLCTLSSYPQFGGKNFFELSEEETKEGEISWWKLREKTREFLSSYLN